MTSRICGLDLQTELRQPEGLFRCGAHSREGTLAPGDSIVEAESLLVAPRRGTYDVRLRHLLQPDRWVAFSIDIR